MTDNYTEWEALYNQTVTSYEGRIASLNNDLQLALQRAGDAELEARQFKARCYPNPTDCLRAEITRGKVEAWLRAHDFKPQPITSEHSETWSRDDINLAWNNRWPIERNASELIESGSDVLGVDQWAVLAEMSAIEVQL